MIDDSVGRCQLTPYSSTHFSAQAKVAHNRRAKVAHNRSLWKQKTVLNRLNLRQSLSLGVSVLVGVGLPLAEAGQEALACGVGILGCDRLD